MEALVKDPLLVPKLTFILMQMANFALGMWKCGSMGLLPTAESDWLGFMQAKTSLERVF